MRLKKIAWMGHGALIGLTTLLVLVASGCGHKETRAPLPATQAAPPAVQTASLPPLPTTMPTTRIAPTPAPPGGISDEDLDYINTHKPILIEEGLATWYRAPYKGRRAANGQVFSDKALTAAHRTLPMGSLIVVTNIRSGESSAMRITDRGPFSEDRILDLTMASAKATGIYRTGLSRVRMEVYSSPKPIDSGGRWCVQIGAFKSERKARKLKQQLLRKYPGASVIEFPGEASYWVRIRPQGDDREQAMLMARRVRPAEGEAYLTRLD